MKSLADQLNDGLSRSALDRKQFLPLSFLQDVVSERNIKLELESADGWTGSLKRVCSFIGLLDPLNVSERVAGKAKKIFAALVLMEKSTAIYGLLEEGLTDDHLPLSRHSNCEALLSCDGTTMFPFENWTSSSVNDFEGHRQWLVLAPELPNDGQLIKVHENCPLPFTECSPKGSGAAGVVHCARLHPKHQQGYEMKTVNLQIAVKEFHHRILVPKKDDSLQGEAPVNEDDFTKEDKILQQIRDVRHRHIIRHFASIDTGKRGYIIFPWADGETLQDYWQTSEGAFCRGRALWSLQQMLGLATALHLLHERFMCRHGDLKPINILCFTECGETVLKIADFGISRIHSKRTIYRKSATTTLGLTPTYQGPEVEFERVSKEEQLPRSRKYDIWSLGCIFLEFSLWLMHGPDAIKGFANARGTSISSTETTLPLYEITNKAAKAAKVHELVSWTIVRLQTDPRCKGDTALAALLSLIKDQMLQPNVESRPSAEDVGKQLEIIVQEAEERHSYLFHPDQGPRVSQLDFERYQPV